MPTVTENEAIKKTALDRSIEAKMRAEIDADVAGIARSVKAGAEQIAGLPAAYRECYGIVQALVDAGFAGARVDYRGSGVTVRVQRSDLTRMYKLVGRLKLGYRTAETVYTDAGRATKIKVILRVPAVPLLTVEYLTDVPTGPNARCRLVTETSTYTTLVCDRE